MSEEKLVNNEENTETPAPGEGNVLAGFVLLEDANMDWLRFKKILKDDWDIEFDDEQLEEGYATGNGTPLPIEDSCNDDVSHEPEPGSNVTVYLLVACL